MAEHLSRYRPDDMLEEGLPTSNIDNNRLEGTYQRLSADELEQMREAAAAIAADMEAGSQSLIIPPPDEVVPFLFTEDAYDESTSPVWGVDSLDDQLLPEEAPTQQQREHARSYYFTLVSLTDKRYHEDETFPEPQEIIEAYTAYCELLEANNQPMAPADRQPGFTLIHLWAAARRQNLWIMRWLQDQRAYEAPEQYEEALFLLLNLENGVAEAACQDNL